MKQESDEQIKKFLEDVTTGLVELNLKLTTAQATEIIKFLEELKSRT